MKTLLLILCLLPSVALADADVVRVKRFHTNGVNCPSSKTPATCKVKSAEILDTSASWTMDVAGYAKLTIQIDHTYVAATHIFLTCEGSLNGGTTYARLTSTSVLAGAGTVSAYTDDYATGSASSNVIFEYGIAGYDNVRCDFSDTAATTDTDTVYARVSVGN